MDVDRLEEVRTEAIKSMQEALDGVEPIEAPLALAVFAMVPLYLWQIGRLAVLFTAALLVNWVNQLWKMITLPFYVARVFIDTVILMTWFFKRIIERMGE